MHAAYMPFHLPPLLHLSASYCALLSGRISCILSDSSAAEGLTCYLLHQVLQRLHESNNVLAATRGVAIAQVGYVMAFCCWSSTLLLLCFVSCI